jgi:uroporphyrinogen-III synthase
MPGRHPARRSAAGARAAALDGRTVLVTRPRDQAERLVEALSARGARALVAPVIRITPAPAREIDRALDRAVAGEFDWILLTSRAGVEALYGRLRARGLRPSAIRASIGAVGEGTAAALRSRRVRPALVPETYTTEALGAAMPRGRGTILLARADIAPEGLEAALARKGWSTVRVDAYRTRLATSLPVRIRRALAGGSIDAVTFTSASTVRGFMKAAGGMFRHPAMAGAARTPAVVCIGPVTAREARAAGLSVRAVAKPHTIDGLVEAVERALRSSRRAPIRTDQGADTP